MERQRGCFLYWALCRPMQQPALSRNLAAVLVPFSYRNFLHSQNRMRTLCKFRDEEPTRNGGASQQKMRFTSSSSLILSRVLYCSGLPRYNFLRMAWYSCRFQVSGSCATLCPPLPHALDRWTGRHADRCYSGGTRDNSTIIVSLWQNVTLTLQHKNASEIYERSSGYRRRLGRRRCHG